MVKIHDVTMPIVPGLPAFPGDPPPAVETLQRAGESPFGLARLSLTTHSGTHVDAPLHFVPGGTSVDLLPLEILMGKTRVVEIQSRERVERGDLEALDLRDDLRVLLKTRMSGQLLPAEFQQDHVYLTGDAATYLAQAGLKLVGFDYLSLETLRHDLATRRTMPCCGAGVVIVEGLDLSEVEAGEYDLVCLPLRMARRATALPPASCCARAPDVGRGGAAERPAPARRGGDPARRRRRRAALPADPRPRQARRALRRAVPDHRLHALELHQLRAAQDLHRSPSTRRRA